MSTDSVFNLSSDEKLQLVEDLWDDLARHPDQIPVQQWQKEELDRRKANLRNNTVSVSSWEAAKARIRNQHGG
ncbi:addiction module protein [bacterium]|nr:addiction module protein [bacterium]